VERSVHVERSVLVTGAATGVGAATVAALAADGMRVWAGVRREEDAERLRAEHGPAVRPLLLDVTDDAAVEAAGRAVVADGPLHGLVNNAGVAVPGPLEHLAPSELRRQLDVNLVGQLAVTQAVLPALRAARGRVVTVGSIGGRIAGPMLGAYHASKFGLLGLTDALRAELAPWGLAVVLVEPGAVATPMWERGRRAGEETFRALPAEAQARYRRQYEAAMRNAAASEARGVPAAAVAAVIRTALTTARPRPRYLVGRDARAAAVVARLPLRLRYRLTAGRA